MANDCAYEIKINGSKEAITRVLECLKADYNYHEGKPNHKHFFRIFEACESEPTLNEDGSYTMFIYGYCAWSVYCCMCSGNHTYYNSLKELHPDTFMGTDLLEQSQDCEIEVFSEEEGMGFSEHYIFKNSKCLCDDTAQVKQAGYTKTGKITTRINWDTYEGDYLCLNPHRENQVDEFRWEI